MTQLIGSRFIVRCKERWAMPVTGARPGRWLRLAEIGYGLRDFLLFIDRQETKIYCEEMIGGHLERIEDDNLFEDLMAFIHEQKLITLEAGAQGKDLPFVETREKR